MKTERETGVMTHAIEIAIEQAQDAHQLHYIIRSKIPGVVGITDEQRKALVKTAWARFSQLNATEPQPYPAGRFITKEAA